VDNLMAYLPGFVAIETSRGLTAGYTCPNFKSNASLRFQPAIKTIRVKNNQLAAFGTIIFPHSLAAQLLVSSKSGVVTVLDVFAGDSLMARLHPQFVKTADGKWICSSSESVLLAPGKYRAKLGLSSAIPNQYSLNSASVALVVEQ
jgi:hypothetical protein